MHANEDGFGGFEVTALKREMNGSIDHAFKCVKLERAKTRWQHCFRHLANQAFVLHPVANQLCDGDHFDFVALAESDEFGNARLN